VYENTHINIFTGVKYDFSTIQHAIRFCGLLRVEKKDEKLEQGVFLVRRRRVPFKEARGRTTSMN
jgi:hypothetical protein